jgi:hypothetical protein
MVCTYFGEHRCSSAPIHHSALDGVRFWLEAFATLPTEKGSLAAISQEDGLKPEQD